MGLDFNNVSNRHQQQVIDLNHLRGHLQARKDEADLRRKNPRNAFNHVSSDKDGFFGSMLLGFLAFGAVGHALLGVEGAMLHTPIVMLESLAQVRDDEARHARRRKVEGYPEGRRQGGFFNQPRKATFNLVAANQNDRFTYDTDHECAVLGRLMDQVDRLIRQGKTEIVVDRRAPLADILPRLMSAPAAGVVNRQVRVARCVA